MAHKDTTALWFKDLQDRICHALELLDGTGKFHEDLWERPEGGGGRSRAINNGTVIEKGGVNFSAVHGIIPARIREALKVADESFFATGVSIVLHPVSPWMPIIHMNVRYFETGSEQAGEKTYWFGGGIDLTPHYIDPTDGGYLHRYLKEVCDATDKGYYQKFKQWADEYFYLKHREETRGVGGIFFDRLDHYSGGKSYDDIWDFVKRVGESFVPIYSHFAGKYKMRTWDLSHTSWQNIRRSRYVEFNLLWDKGTKFGLDTNGRTESILMSMPPEARWEYKYTPSANSPEAETLRWLKKDIDWISYA